MRDLNKHSASHQQNRQAPIWAPLRAIAYYTRSTNYRGKKWILDEGTRNADTRARTPAHHRVPTVDFVDAACGDLLRLQMLAQTACEEWSSICHWKILIDYT